jgi:PAS domain S-box-containing protein
MSIGTNNLNFNSFIGDDIKGDNDGDGDGMLDDIFDEFLFSSDNGISSLPQTNKKGTISEITNGDSDEDDEDDDDDEVDSEWKKRKRQRGLHKNMSEEQKIERRERNREHAKRSRVRKKFLLESLQQSVHALQEENEKLKASLREHIPSEAETLIVNCSSTGLASVIASDPTSATKTLDDPDYSLVKALQTAQQNFVISDPSLPDNPIVYASQGFLALTGYTLDQVLGRNCRFLQGPATDPKAVAKIRKGIEKGEDTTVVLLNYRIDGTTFWNQFFVAALRDGNGSIVNYLGVQCKVSEDYANAFEKNTEKSTKESV